MQDSYDKKGGVGLSSLDLEEPGMSTSLPNSDDTPYREALRLPTEQAPSWNDVDEAGKRLGGYLHKDRKRNGLAPLAKVRPLVKPDRKFVRLSVTKTLVNPRHLMQEIEGHGWSIAENMQLTVQALGACLAISDVVINWDGLKLVTDGFPYIDDDSFVSPLEAQVYKREKQDDPYDTHRTERSVIPIRTIEPYIYSRGIPVDEQMKLLDYYIAGEPDMNQGRLTTIRALRTPEQWVQRRRPTQEEQEQRELTPTAVADAMVNLMVKNTIIDLNELRKFQSCDRTI